MAGSTTTMWGGLTVGKRALQNWKQGGSDRNFINNILKYNQTKLGAREIEGKQYGLEDPKKALREAFKQARTESHQQPKVQGHRRLSEREYITDTIRTQVKSGMITPNFESFSSNFRRLAGKTMDKAERQKLRKFMGWKTGFDVKKAGFTWNPDEKRFEKVETYDGVEVVKWFRYRTEGKGVRGDRYSNKVIEYGVD